VVYVSSMSSDVFYVFRDILSLNILIIFIHTTMCRDRRTDQKKIDVALTVSFYDAFITFMMTNTDYV